jgi:segregation and condensation protein B
VLAPAASPRLSTPPASDSIKPLTAADQVFRLRGWVGDGFTLPIMTLKHVVEALLFGSQKPLLPKDILAALKFAADFSSEEPVIALSKTKVAAIGETLAELRDQYEGEGRAFRLQEHAGGWQLVSDPACSVWLRQLFPESRPTRLSAPALETLAIIAYRQPITRADIEAVRGVAVDGVMQTLLDRGLVKIAGRAEVPGRPLLYETTQSFMEHFALKNLDDLPNATELRRIELPKAEPPKAAVPTAEVPAAEPELPVAPEGAGEGGEAAAEKEGTEMTEGTETTEATEAEASPEDQPK